VDQIEAGVLVDEYSTRFCVLILIYGLAAEPFVAGEQSDLESRPDSRELLLVEGVEVIRPERPIRVGSSERQVGAAVADVDELLSLETRLMRTSGWAMPPAQPPGR
jgi:hypothetical protein